MRNGWPQFSIEVTGRWTKVTYGIFRSWSGRRKYYGEDFHGKVFQLGEGLPNPWKEEDAYGLWPGEMVDEAITEAIENDAGEDWKIEI